MTSNVATPEQAPPGARARLLDLVNATEVDGRLLGMIVTLIAIEIGFGLYTGGSILSPVNLLTFATQAVQIAIIATGMVLVIVSRNIDLSVGSVLGVIAMTYAVLMHEVFPTTIGVDTPYGWLIALGVGLVLGILMGALQGFLIAYAKIPSFVVTLGGLLAFRGLVFDISGGSTQAPDDKQFVVLGGSALGSLGGTVSWIFGGILVLAIAAYLFYNRRQRRKFGFPLRPMWAEVTLAVVGCAIVLGLAWFANNNFLARSDTPAGLPYPIILLIVVTLVMTFIATRRKFGRYVYAYGGNPDAAELAGINTRWTILKTYVVMGVLCALAGAVAAGRLNGATLDVGQSYELYVIAAAVVGGTSFAGGIGTIPGAVLGAFVMQALAYGLSFLNVISPGQNIAVGIVLIIAVGLDTYNRRRGS